MWIGQLTNLKSTGPGPNTAPRSCGVTQVNHFRPFVWFLEGKKKLGKDLFLRIPSANIFLTLPLLHSLNHSEKSIRTQRSAHNCQSTKWPAPAPVNQKTLQRTAKTFTYFQWFCWSFHVTPTCPDASKPAWSVSFTVGLWKKKSNEIDALLANENCLQTQKGCLWKQPRSRKKWWNPDFNLFLLPGWGFPELIKHNACD